MKKNQILSPFKTRDLSEASTLVTLGQNLIRLEHDGQRFWFIFENVAVCEELSRQFWEGKLLVNPREFALNFRAIKDRLHSQH